MNSSQVKAMARQFGADLVGIAPLSRFADVPKQQNPASIFPQGKNMIVVARRIPRGTLRGTESGSELDNSYPTFGFYYLEDQYLAKTTYDLTIWMETQGVEAVPMFGYDARESANYEFGTPVAPGKAAPNVYVDYQLAARLAGLGEVGRHGLFLTPEFGTRQRFAMLITDAELEPDAEKELHFCDGCRDCVAMCPLGALPETGGEPVRELCSHCRNGAIETNFGRFNTIDRIAAACGRACLASLEKRGLLTRHFNHAFRDGDTAAWAKDYYGRSCAAAGEGREQ